MSVIRYSKARDGLKNITPHFKIQEFACRDGSDEILLDTALPPILEDIRKRVGNRPLAINSGYRTPAYNQRIGGAKESYHMKGMAADISVAGVKPDELAAAAELAQFAAGKRGGVGQYQTFVHVDVRQGVWRQNMVTGKTVTGFGPAARPTLRRGNTSNDSKVLQERLNALGASLTADGVFGAKTEAAVRAFQIEKKLSADGIVGRTTWCALYI